MVRKVLVTCGVLSSLFYVAMNVFVPMQWRDYSALSQTVSELSAIGAPTRALWVSLGVVYTILVITFGCGVWLSAGGNRPLRVVGALIVAFGVVGVAVPPMHLRGVTPTLTDGMHIAYGIALLLLMLLTIGFGAAAFGKRFRFYSIATLAVFVVSGVLTGLDSPRIATNLPTPWIGLWERINIAAFMLWVMILAVMLALRRTSPRQGFAFL